MSSDNNCTKPPKNAIRCDCRHRRQCHETQLQLFRRDPTSKFFGFSRVRIPPFIKRPYDVDSLTVQESKKLLVINSLVTNLGITHGKLMRSDVVHISKHHWKEAAIDYVAAKGDKFGMTHIFEFASREEWLQANTLEDDAAVFSARPKFKAFLAPNQGVDEWPLLYGHSDGANEESSNADIKHTDRKLSPDSLYPASDSQVREDFISSFMGNLDEVELGDYDFEFEPAEEQKISHEIALQAFQEQETLDEIDTSNLQSMWQTAADADVAAAVALVDVPLRQWIKYAKLSIEDTDGKQDPASLTFLHPALKIAICLAEQISQSETLMSMATNWAEFVVVQVEQDGCVNLQISPTSFLRREEKEPDLNQELEKLLESYGETGSDYPDASTLYASSSFSTKKTSESNDDGALELEHLKALHFLNVQSAVLQWPETEPKSIYNCIIDVDESIGKYRQIYYLSLVFYELFSGGQIPPPTLHALASFDGAFISLSTTTLVKRSGAEPSATHAKRHQGPSTSEVIGLCQLSFEYLRLMGISSPICCLIYNMMDCVYGDLSGKDCYSSVFEVMLDLMLMSSKPSKFLRGFNMDNIPILATQLQEIDIPRHQEFNAIMTCYRRCEEGSCEITIIQGESGSGKSWMSQKVLRLIAAQGGIVVTSKFDQMKQAKPFAAIATAFDSFIDVLIKSKQHEWANDIINKMQDALGEDACHLMNVIPKLSLIIDGDVCQNTAAPSLLDTSAQNSVQRLHDLFCRFIEVISVNVQVSLTLCLDDIQWADEASIDLLAKLVQRKKKFFFLGCCRDDEVKNSPFERMLTHLRAADIKTTTVQLKRVEEDCLNSVISELLCLSPRLIRPFSRIVHSKTRGNVLFISQLMLSLNRDGLIYLDFNKQRWVWNEEKILSTKLPENVAICYTNGIIKLPIDEQLALHALSVFGASARIMYLVLLENQLGLKLVEPLTRAAAEGLVINHAGSFHFCHDRIQEASYNLIGGLARRSNHSIYGRCLVQYARDIGDDDMLFVAVNQINIAGPASISNADECYTMANHNLIAGKKAMAMSAFASAYSLLEHGICFLDEENHWQNHYKFSLTLYELACQSALASANINGLNRLLKEAMQHVKCSEDKLNLQFIHLSSLAHSSKLTVALQTGLTVLSDLGEEIPINPSHELVTQIKICTQSMLAGFLDHEILSNLPTMTNTRTIAAMKFLARLQTISFIENHKLHTIIILKMVQLSLREGLCPASAFGFACFGSFIAKTGDLSSGHRFVSLAKSLLNKVEAKESAGEILCMMAEVKSYVEPFLAANELRVQAEAAALRIGDTNWACCARTQFCYGLFWGGTNLHIVREKSSAALTFFRVHDHKPVSAFQSVLQRSIHALCEKESDAPPADGVSARLHWITAFHTLYLTFMFNGNGIKEQCENLLQTKASFSFLTTGHSIEVMIIGLCSCQLYRQTGDAVWADRAKKCSEKMKAWVEQGSSWNFKQKLLLMQAEEHYSSGDLNHAKDLYRGAITYAKQHKFLNDESLACELAARFYLGIGEESVSLEHFRQALDKYHEWGAVRKANSLFEYINTTLRQHFVKS